MFQDYLKRTLLQEHVANKSRPKSQKAYFVFGPWENYLNVVIAVAFWHKYVKSLARFSRIFNNFPLYQREQAPSVFLLTKKSV